MLLNLDNPEKKKDFLDFLANYFDDIKKQITSMQQNNSVQSQLISLIYKNIDSFIEQLSGPHQIKYNHPNNYMQTDSMNSFLNKFNDGSLPANILNNIPANILNSMQMSNNNKQNLFGEGKCPNTAGFNPMNLQNISLPMNVDQQLLNNSFGFNNFNQIFQNNMNLFPPINHLPQIGFPHNLQESLLMNAMNPILHQNNNRNLSTQFNKNQIINPLNNLLQNQNAKNNNNKKFEK